MNIEKLFDQHKDELEDFWGRKQHRPDIEKRFHIFGRPVQMTANQPRILSAASLVVPLYSTANPVDEPPLRIELVVTSPGAMPGQPLDNLFDHIEYAGHGPWATIDLAGWGHCYIDLEEGHAIALVKPELADQPELVARYLLNTVLTNLIIAQGFGMLHATALFRQGHLLLLMAPHNSGKSTTALYLALAGYALVSDSMIYVCPQEEGPRIFAFPVGRVKLRPDMLDKFPEVSSLLEREPVRGEMKYGIDLREHDSTLVHSESILPDRVTLYLLSRSEEQGTVIKPAHSDEVWKSVMANSLFYDESSPWLKNLAHIDSLINVADCYHLSAGTDPANMVTAIQSSID